MNCYFRNVHSTETTANTCQRVCAAVHMREGIVVYIYIYVYIYIIDTIGSISNWMNTYPKDTQQDVCVKWKFKTCTRRIKQRRNWNKITPVKHYSRVITQWMFCVYRQQHCLLLATNANVFATLIIDKYVNWSTLCCFIFTLNISFLPRLP